MFAEPVNMFLYVKGLRCYLFVELSSFHEHDSVILIYVFFSQPRHVKVLHYLFHVLEVSFITFTAKHLT